MEDVWLVAASHKDYALLITPLISLNFSLRMKQRISKCDTSITVIYHAMSLTVLYLIIGACS
jgi:hypothetical protein